MYCPIAKRDCTEIPHDSPGRVMTDCRERGESSYDLLLEIRDRLCGATLREIVPIVPVQEGVQNA